VSTLIFFAIVLLGSFALWWFVFFDHEGYRRSKAHSTPPAERDTAEEPAPVWSTAQGPVLNLERGEWRRLNMSGAAR
jgi:cytoskeletal protein RodZ